MKSIRSTFFRALIFTSLLALFASTVQASTITTMVDSGGYYTSLALNSSGFPIISYAANGGSDLKVAICGNATCSAGNTLTIVDHYNNTDAIRFTSLVLNSQGFPVISYQANNTLKVAICGNETCSTGNTLTTVDNIGYPGYFTSLALNSNGFPVIGYFNNSNGDLKVAVCGNATCSFGNTLTTVDSGSMGEYTSLALNSNGFPVISYYDRINNDLKVGVCGNATCTAGNTLTTVDSIGDTGYSTSLELDSKGFPIISYYDYTNSHLKVAICGNATCSTGNTFTIVDNIRWASTSLELNNSDFPIISYTADSSSDLKVAICGNATCSAGNTLTTVDSFAGSISLALNNSGFPVISYNNTINENLKVAVLDSVAPTVASQSLSSSYSTGPSSFTVTFSEDVFNPSGNTDTNDVTNPANYLLVEDGANGTFNTASCEDGLISDDTKIIFNNVSYNSITFTSTVNINNGIALPAGKYKLFVCGTTSITDLALNKLNNGASDYTFEFNVESKTSSLPKTGFAPNRITALPIQPAQLAYSNLDSLWLEIPSLKIKTNIIGVPKTDQGWNVNWLGQDAGWLNGTAFPSWEGNSVITAHVTNANGLPGPFANLKNLKYGDRIIVHLYGQQYVFEVQSSRIVRPTNTKSAIEHIEGHSYLTLITCQGYNSLNDSYLFRRVVRAVLVEVK